MFQKQTLSKCCLKIIIYCDTLSVLKYLEFESKIISLKQITTRKKMKNLRKFFAAFAVAVLNIGISFAQLQMPAVFTDGMVLQQNSNVRIWGWGSASETVTVSPKWEGAQVVKTKVDSNGKWSTEISTPSAGGPYSIDITNGRETITLSDVLLGEVWLCSGQSNMEWSVNHGIMNGDKEAANAACATLRIFHMPKQGADSPQDDCRTKWEKSSPESMRRTSATAYFFGRMLTEKLNVPVGIMVAAWGGTPAEVWTPAEEVKNDPVLSNCKLSPAAWWPITPGVLYNQMIHPMIPYEIAGCIWYQGESNHENASSYERLMTKLVNSWRKDFGKDFPFYYVQIAPHTYNSKKNTPAQLREQQMLMAEHVDNCAMINISDLVENVKDIHPRNKRAIGERLAKLALDKTYGKYVGAYESPKLKEAVRSGKKITLSFDGNFEKLTSTSKEITGFAVVDTDGKQIPAKAKIKGREIIISTGSAEAPVQILYCFDDATIGSLRTDAGLPVLPFRTKIK